MEDIHEGTCKIIDMLYDSFKDRYSSYVRMKVKLGMEGLKKEIRSMEVEELIRMLTKIDGEVNKILYGDE